MGVCGAAGAGGTQAAGMGGRHLSWEDFHWSLRLEQGKKTEGKFKDAET